MNQLKSNIMM